MRTLLRGVRHISAVAAVVAPAYWIGAVFKAIGTFSF